MRFLEANEIDPVDLHWELSLLQDSYHATCMHVPTKQVGGGFSRSLATSKNIAFAELSERLLVQQIVSRPDLHEWWGIDIDCSGSGFAAGFEKSRTWLRALLEAVERWTLSRWIDHRQQIPKIDVVDLSPAASHISSYFESYSIYHINIPIVVGTDLVKVDVAVVLAWTENGVFAGYGSKLDKSKAVEHAFVESLRNYLIFKNQRPRIEFPFDRISYFGRNRTHAERMLQTEDSASKWSIPSIRIARIQTVGNLWLARVILNGWRPWQEGASDRFLY